MSVCNGILHHVIVFISLCLFSIILRGSFIADFYFISTAFISPWSSCSFLSLSTVQLLVTISSYFSNHFNKQYSFLFSISFISFRYFEVSFNGPLVKLFFCILKCGLIYVLKPGVPGFSLHSFLSFQDTLRNLAHIINFKMD